MFPLTNPRAAEEGWGICRAERGAVQGGSLAEYPHPHQGSGQQGWLQQEEQVPSRLQPPALFPQ